jgi:ssDNA-binding replication factor A large subunit
MFKLNYDEIINRIVEEKGISKEEVENKVNSKMEKLSGLISKEGAIHIIANEYGINVFYDLGKKRFKINELKEGMRSVEVVGKIIRKYDTREFKTDKREGKVGSVLIGDETGIIRFVFWDINLIDRLENTKEDDILKVMNGYIRNNQGYLEVHVGSQGDFEVNPAGETVGEINQNSSSRVGVLRKKIADLNQNEFVEVFGTIVQVFEPRFYEACNECNRKVNPQGDDYICSEHGKVAIRYIPIVNAFFDDGSGNIRLVCFRDIASKLLKISEDEVQKFRVGNENFEEIRKKVLGDQIIVRGKINKNEMFDRIELVASDIKEADPRKLIEELSK